MGKIIGRKKEQGILEEIWNSEHAELVAVYGRRRVGKTFLIREYFGSKKCYFELAGNKGASLSAQLKNFAEAFSKTFYSGIEIAVPRNWRDALALLTKEIEKKPSLKILLFFDELPWLASKKSKFMQALDYFWNTYWSQMPQVKVILCGSAASWMLDQLINAKGGLHNRITCTIQLWPFNLQETQSYLLSHNIRLSEKQLLDLFMVMGGIPHYLNYVKKGKSAEQNIQEICFANEGFLFTEFERLFTSLFDKAEVHLQIIREIAKKKNGILREELLDQLHMTSGGRFNKRIDELQAAGFIRGFVPYQNKKKKQYFRIVDEYSAFYLTWIDPLIGKGFPQTNYWKTCQRNPEWATWVGYAFESICLKHLTQIVHALDLDSIPCEIGSWRFIPKKGSKEKGAQIDLLFDRTDNAVTLCEIKCSKEKFVIDKAYAKELYDRMEVFQEKTKTKKQVFLAMITASGIRKNLWAQDLVTNEVVLKDFFVS